MGRVERCLFKNKVWQKKSHRSFVILVALVILTDAHKNLLFWTLLTSAVIGTRGWAGVDSAWEQEKLEARKMLENAAESPAPSARCVGWLSERKTCLRKKTQP
jgi:hypothetical protein